MYSRLMGICRMKKKSLLIMERLMEQVHWLLLKIVIISYVPDAWEKLTWMKMERLLRMTSIIMVTLIHTISLELVWEQNIKGLIFRHSFRELVNRILFAKVICVVLSLVGGWIKIKPILIIHGQKEILMPVFLCCHLMVL